MKIKIGNIQIPSDELTVKNFNDAREIFINEENNRLKNSELEIKYSDKKDFPSDKEINIAVNCAKRDVMVRTLGNPKPGFFKDENSIEFQNFIDEIKVCLKSDKACFDTNHDDACNAAKQFIGKYYNGVKYGKGQKLVNMTLKYLYCIAPGTDKVGEYGECFEYCHMPLDSIMLDWVKRESTDLIDIPPWSKLNQKKYGEVVNAIKKIDLKGLSVLQAEFIIWPRMKLKQATEQFLNTLGVKKNTVKKNSLKDDLKLIEDFLDM